MMLGWVADVEKATLENDNFRTALYTGAHTQLTVMSLAAGEDIGLEAHDHLDQFLRVEQGQGRGQSIPTARSTRRRPKQKRLNTITN
jgi:hypothetical protein